MTESKNSTNDLEESFQASVSFFPMISFHHNPQVSFSKKKCNSCTIISVSPGSLLNKMWNTEVQLILPQRELHFSKTPKTFANPSARNTMGRTYASSQGTGWCFWEAISEFVLLLSLLVPPPEKEIVTNISRWKDFFQILFKLALLGFVRLFMEDRFLAFPVEDWMV